MKNKQTTESQYLAQGVYKKRILPCLLVIAAALSVAAVYAIIAIEFFTAPRCGGECKTYFNYTFHYANLINFVLAVALVLVLVVIIGAILFIRKRTLVVTPSAILYRRGRKVVNIPLNTIESINFALAGIRVTTSDDKYKFSKLKNKKEIYDTILTQMNPSYSTGINAVATLAAQSLAVMAAPMLNTPTLQGKLAYFKKLLESGVITPEQYDKYIEQSLKAESAN